MNNLTNYDYHLPPELIADVPLARRDESRLLVVEGSTGGLSHRSIRDLASLLAAGDCLVMNDTKVIPARLFGRRAATGGRWEGLYLESTANGDWRLIGQTRGRLRPGEQIIVTPAHRPDEPDELTLTLIEFDADEGIWTARPGLVESSLVVARSPDRATRASADLPDGSGDLRSGRVRGRETRAQQVGRETRAQQVGRETRAQQVGRETRAQQVGQETRAQHGAGFPDPVDLLARFGTVPLPPYIRRKLGTDVDRARYQTVYARHPGAVAAPTAGLHLTPELLGGLEAVGVGSAFVTLHVGIGTFRPIDVDDLERHRMHREWCELSAETARRLRETRESGHRIVAVGTTSVRTLESAAAHGEIAAYRGETDLFIRPPHSFRAVDALLTNFHLPRSTLLVLVTALAGPNLIRRAYQEAIRERYRFYSYGDAMLIV